MFILAVHDPVDFSRMKIEQLTQAKRKCCEREIQEKFARDVRSYSSTYAPKAS